MFGKWKKRCEKLQSDVEYLEGIRDSLESKNDKLTETIREMQRKSREDIQIPLNRGLFNFMGQVLEIRPTSDISIDTFYSGGTSFTLDVRSELIPGLNLSKNKKRRISLGTFKPY